MNFYYIVNFDNKFVGCGLCTMQQINDICSNIRGDRNIIVCKDANDYERAQDAVRYSLGLPFYKLISIINGQFNLMQVK